MGRNAGLTALVQMRLPVVFVAVALLHPSLVGTAVPRRPLPASEISRKLDQESMRLRRQLDMLEQRWVDGDTMLCMCNTDGVFPLLFQLASRHWLTVKVEARDDEATRRATQRTVFQVSVRGRRRDATEFMRDLSSLKVLYLKMSDLSFHDDGEVFAASFRLGLYRRQAAVLLD
jgi:hypothetical protein